jgi:hypothetical protein
VGALLVFASAGALAHTQPPAPISIRARQGSSNELLLGVTFGALLSADRGGSWRWICEESIGAPTGADVHYLWAADGSIWAPTLLGLLVSRDGGCTFGLEPTFGTKGVSDLEAGDPNDPNALVATVMTGTGTAQLFLTRDLGKSFVGSPLALSARSFTSVRVAPSDAARVYVAAFWYSPRALFLERSDTGTGGPWTELGVGIPNAIYWRVLAVDPTSPEVLFGHVAGTSTDSVIRSEDGGRSWNVVLTSSTGLRGVEIGPDGRTVWAATVDRVFRSIDGGRTFGGPLHVPTRSACVGRVGSVLYACGFEPQDGFSLGASDDLGDHFTSVFRFAEIQGVIDCPAGTKTHDLCGSYLPILEARLGIDAGTPAPIMDAGTPTTAPQKGGCRCDALGQPDGVVLLLCALLLFCRSRRGLQSR